METMQGFRLRMQAQCVAALLVLLIHATAVQSANAVVQSVNGESYNLTTVQELRLAPFVGPERPIVRIGASLQIDCCSTFSKLGNDILQAWSMLVDHINDARGGLLVNGTRHAVQLEILADYSKKELTEQNTRSLIQRGHSFLLAPYGSGQSEYAASVVNETQHALLIAPCASRRQVFLDRPRVYGMLPRSEDYLQSAVQTAAEAMPSHRHAALLCEDHGVSRSWARGLRQHLSAFNFTTHKDKLIPFKTGSNNPGELEDLLSEWLADFAAADVKPFIFGVTYDYETCTKLVKLSERMAFRKQVSGLFFTTCIDRGSFQFDVKEAARYVSGVSPWAEFVERPDVFTGTTALDFKKRFNSKFSRIPGYVAAAAHGALVTLCWAIESAQSQDVELVRQQLERLNSPASALSTLYAEIYFDAHGQNAQRMRVIQYQGDGLTLRDVASAADFVLDMGTCAPGQQHNDSTKLCEVARCDAGQEFSPAINKCTPCRRGKKKGVDDFECVDCEAGSFSTNEGMSECLVCKPGTFSRTGRWFCDMCEVGYIAALPGQGKCAPCAQGLWSNTAGSTQCSACPESMVTPLQGANSPTECVCPPNMYLSCRPHGGSRELCKVRFNISEDFRCEPCKDGFACPGGKEVTGGNDYHAQPALEEKFYASEDAPYEAYECVDAGALCQGSGEAQCGGGRKGLQCYSCGNMGDGLYSELGGPCRDCGSGKFMLSPLAVLLIFPLLLFVYRATSKDRSRYTARTALLGTMNMLVSFSQLYAILGSVSITWVEPLKTIFGYLALLLFDVRMLGPSCYVGDSSYLAVYLPGVSVPVIIIGSMFLMWFVSKISPCLVLSRDNAVNTLGTVLLALYVGVCKPVFGIFECRQNASAPPTVRSHDGFLCFPDGDEVFSTLPVAILCILVYVVGFVCLYVYVIYRAPRDFTTSNSFRLKYRFILSRWHPSSWFWGIFVLMRNVLCSLVPAMHSDGMLQLLLLIFFIYPVFVVQVRIWPWRDEIANKQDMVLTAALLLTIISGITLQAQQLLSGVKSILVVMSVFSLGAGFLMTLLILGHFSVAMLLNGSAVTSTPSRKSGLRDSQSPRTSLGSKASDESARDSTTQARLTTLFATLRMSSNNTKPDVKRVTRSESSNEALEEIGNNIYETLQGVALLREQYGDEQVARLVIKFVAEVPEFDLKRLTWFSDMLAYNLLGQSHRQPKGITLPSFVSRRKSWPPPEDEEKPGIQSPELHEAEEFDPSPRSSRTTDCEIVSI